MAAGGKVVAEKMFTLEPLRKGYGRTFFFDKFAIERVDAGFFLGFWYSRPSGAAGYFGCFIAKPDAVRFVESFKKYLEQIGRVGTPVVDAMPPACISAVPVVRQLRCTRSGDVAEIDFSFFPLSSFVGQEAKNRTIEIEPVAVAVSDLNVHVDFVTLFIKVIESKGGRSCLSPP